jgi:hypothetical protein
VGLSSCRGDPPVERLAELGENQWMPQIRQIC